MNAYVIALFIGASSANWQSTTKISIDQDKVNKAGKEVGEFINEVASDVKDYNQKKETLDKAFAANVMTNWTSEAKAVQDAYGSAFDAFRNTANISQDANGMTTIKLDNANATVATAISDAVTKDMQTGQQWGQDIIKYDSDVKQLQKDTLNVTKWAEEK